jgi:hypothetical protein
MRVGMSGSGSREIGKRRGEERRGESVREWA